MKVSIVLIVILSTIFIGSAFSAMPQHIVLEGKIKSFNKRIVNLKTKSGVVKVPRHFFKRAELQSKWVKIDVPLKAILNVN